MLENKRLMVSSSWFRKEEIPGIRTWIKKREEGERMKRKKEMRNIRKI